MRKLKALLASLIILAFASSAFGQAVKQSGNITVGHVPWWVTSGVIGDSGTSADSSITSMGVTQNGGNGICVNSARNTAAGHNSICLGAQTNGAASLSIQNYGTASPQTLNFIVNGTTTSLSSLVFGITIMPSSNLATAAVLPNSPAYVNGSSGVGATLTANTNTTLTVDGTAATLNTVVLVKDQASAAQNGIYTVTQAGSGSLPWILTRATYFDQSVEMLAGSYTFISGGATNVSKAYVLQQTVTAIGTTVVTFNLYSNTQLISILAPRISNTCYVNGTSYATLTAALVDCSSNSTIIIATNQNIGGSGINITGAGVHIKCENNSTLSYTTTTAFIAFSGANGSIENCILAGLGTGTPTTSPLAILSTNFVGRNNTISGFGFTSTSGIISNFGQSVNISGLILEGNKLSNNGDLGILISGNSTINNIIINENIIDNGIYINPGNVAATNFVISNNVLSFGGGSVNTNLPANISASCIEVIADSATPGGATLSGLAVTGNTCTVTVNQPNNGSECYGFGNLVNYAITGNICTTNGLLMASGFIEINGGVGGSIVGNVTDNTLGIGILCYNCSHATISDNEIRGFGTGAQTWGILITTNSTITIGNIIISNNYILFAAGSAQTGIQIDCRNAGSTCSAMEITGNHIESDGTASSKGIHIQKTTGTMAGFMIGPNMLRAPATGVLIDAGVTSICLLAGLNTSATPTTNNGSASSCL